MHKTISFSVACAPSIIVQKIKIRFWWKFTPRQLNLTSKHFYTFKHLVGSFFLIKKYLNYILTFCYYRVSDFFRICYIDFCRVISPGIKLNLLSVLQNSNESNPLGERMKFCHTNPQHEAGFVGPSLTLRVGIVTLPYGKSIKATSSLRFGLGCFQLPLALWYQKSSQTRDNGLIRPV